MAILSKLIVGACALASVVQAYPAFPRLKVMTVTDVVTVTDYETVNAVTTVWKPINESPAPTPTSSVESHAPVATPSSAPAAPVAPSVSPVVASAAPTTTPAAVAPSSAPSVQAQQAAAPSTSEAAAPSPVQTSVTTPAAAAPVAAAPASSSVPAAAPSAAAGSFVSSASASNTCEGSGAACEGDVTHWDGGLGACGWNVNTASDMEVALPVGFMGSASNSNPYCGRSLTILNPTTGQTFQAKVGDKCMGCQGRAIDLTDALFTAVTSGTGDGRVSGIQWWLN